MKVRDLRKGQIVYECERGQDIRMECLEDARRDIDETDGKDGHSCRVRLDGGQEMELFQTIKENLHHYGPHLYDTPQYS